MDDFLRLLPATPADFDTLRDIGRQAFQEDKLAYGQGPDIYENPEFLRPLLSEDGVVHKLMWEGAPIGLTVTFRRTPASCWLGCLCILPAWQGRGLGGQALCLLEAAYPEVCQWALDTPAANPRNRHFYEKAGYQEIERTVTDEGLELVVFEKRLS